MAAVEAWRTALGADPTDWLLDGEEPGVRAAALTELLDRPRDDADVLASRRAVMTSDVVRRIMAAQLDDGHWGSADRFYRDKYRGTVWQLIVLASLGADGADDGVRAGCEAVLRDGQHAASGGFGYDRSRSAGGAQPSTVIPCLTGNLAWALVRLGMIDDARVQAALNWIATYQRFDTDGPAPRGWPYEREPCWGRHTCHMGAVKALKALAEVPAGSRTSAMQETIDAGVDYLLRHHVHKRCHDPSVVARPGWLRFGYPLMYQTDVLEVLGILAALGVHDDRMAEAVDAVVVKADDAGRLRLESTFNDRMVARVEVKGRQSRWLTLEALRVLRAW